MKKTLSIVCALLMAASLFSACSSRSDDGGSSSQDADVSQGGETSVPVTLERPSVSEAAANNTKVDEDMIDLVQLRYPEIGDRVAVIKTSEGSIVMMLYPEHAPLAVENFINLADSGFYNGKVFHFVQENYMIQTGAVNSNGTGSRSSFVGEDGEQEYFDTEHSWDLWHFRGAVSLDPSSDGKNGSRFTIIDSFEIHTRTLEEGFEAGQDEDEVRQEVLDELKAAGFPQKVIDAYESEGGIPYRDGYHTVFGMVVEGMDVVDRIAETPADATGTPNTPVIIESVTLTNYTGEGMVENDQQQEEQQEEE